MAIIQALPESSLVLDNDIFTHWRNDHSYVRNAIDAYQSRHKLVPALTSITVFEALKGIEAAAAKPTVDQERNLRYRIRAKLLIDSCIVLPFDQNAAAIAAYIFPRIPNNRVSKLWGDIFIAATAMAHSYGIATGNRKDFELIANHLPPAHRLYLAVWKP